jgi:hypothetical protein
MLLPKAPIQRRAFSPREIAAQLGRDRASVYRWLASGELRPIAVSGRLMISDRELERFLDRTRARKLKLGRDRSHSARGWERERIRISGASEKSNFVVHERCF